METKVIIRTFKVISENNAILHEIGGKIVTQEKRQAIQRKAVEIDKIIRVLEKELE